MERTHLNETLSEIEGEIAQIERGAHLDEETRALLVRLSQSIGALLVKDAASSGQEDQQTLADLLKDGIDHFEEDHPKLTMAMGRLATTLSGMGI